MSKVIGVDVAKDFIVCYDGKAFYIYGNAKKGLKKRLPKAAKRKKVKVIHVKSISEIASEGDRVILEQTGTYGLRYVKLFQEIGAEVYIADGKSLHRFRTGKREEKDDYVDAQAIREIYFTARKKHVHKFHYERYRLRTLVRHRQRLSKELTRSVNRLKQQLVHLFPKENYHNLKRYKLFKSLEKLEVELMKHPDATALVALSELRNISHLVSSIEVLEKEIESIVKNHSDYEILKSFGFGILQMAALIGYYWDISLFKTKKAFIAYCLMGVRKEQSGESVDKVKTDRNRSEIKGVMYMHFKSAHKRNSPYLPLAFYLKFKESNHKKRFVKYLDKIFEWVYYALKYRLTFAEIIEKRIRENRKQLEKLQLIIPTLKPPKTEDEAKYNASILGRYYSTSDLLLVCQDISTRLRQKAAKASGVECQDYYKETTQIRGKDEQGTVCPRARQENSPDGGVPHSFPSRESHTGLYGGFEREGFRWWRENQNTRLR